MSSSYFWSAFVRFSFWGVEALTLLPMLILFTVSLGSLVLAVRIQKPFENGRWKPWYWLLFSQLLFFPAIIAVGVSYPASNPQPNHLGEVWLDGFFWASLLMSGFWIIQMKGIRWVAASFMAVQEVVLLGAMCIAGMSISGEWL